MPSSARKKKQRFTGRCHGSAGGCARSTGGANCPGGGSHGAAGASLCAPCFRQDCFFFFLRIRRPPKFTLFPSPPLFRSFAKMMGVTQKPLASKEVQAKSDADLKK